MKSVYYYIVLLAFTVYSLWVAFTWDIPVNNQIGMFFMGCLSISLTFLLIYEDIKGYVKKRKNRPQTF